MLPIKEAKAPAFFAHAPEFNAPAHGTWNIVHVGMLVPEAHQIYVCAKNCMRGVVMTAAEMNASDRFSMVILEERDLTDGNVEKVTIEGTTAVLENMKKPMPLGRGKLPPVVMLFTVCTHRFIGADLDYIYGELEKRFPDVIFLRCFMEPITQKEGRSPDERLRKTMFDPLKLSGTEQNKLSGKIAILGSDFALSRDADLRKIAEESSAKLLEIQSCKSFEEYLGLGDADLFISVFPRARYGAEETAKRLGKPHLYLPASYSYDEIEKEEKELVSKLRGIYAGDKFESDEEKMSEEFARQRKLCEEALRTAKSIIGNTPVCIDYTFHPRVFGLAKLLIRHGFNVEKIYADTVLCEDREAFEWLRENAPNIMLKSTIRPEARMRQEGNGSVLAIGQMAAWFEDTKHFVNVVEGGDLWGFDGIRRTAKLMTKAYENEKDTKDLIPRKGLGCISCF